MTGLGHTHMYLSCAVLDIVIDETCSVNLMTCCGQTQSDGWFNCGDSLVEMVYLRPKCRTMKGKGEVMKLHQTIIY